MMKKKRLKSLLAAVLAVSLLAVCPFAVSAAPDVPYASYAYWEGDGNKVPVQNKACFVPKCALSAASPGLSGMKAAEHIFAYRDALYVLDGENGRIYVLDHDYRSLQEIKSLSYQGKSVSFVGAKGLYADESGLYIADTANKRVLCTDGKTVKKIITCPESDAIPENYSFAPMRLSRDSNGYLYVLCENSYYGIMLFSDKDDFLGFYGSNQVEVKASDAIASLIASLFETEEKHSASVQALPFQLVDFCIDSEGFVTTITDQSRGQIKRFGTRGTNILIHNDHFSADSADGYNFADHPVAYQNKTSTYGTWLVEEFCCVACDADGYVYAVDSTQGRIFMYDTQCQLITVFGGGVSAGTQVGTFVTPNAIACFGEDVIVSDFRTGQLTVFRMTEYGKRIRKANSLTDQSRFSEAKPLWESIFREDKNCQLAYKGLAKAALEEKDYRKAMTLAKDGIDRVTYTAAWKEVRNDFVHRNFLWLGIGAALLIGAAVWFVSLTRKKSIVLIRQPKLRTALTAWIHPFRSFGQLREERFRSVPIAAALMILYYIATVAGELNGGFMYVSSDHASYNALYTFLGTVGVVLLFTLMNWAVSTLFSGRGTIREIYCGTCYCLVPMILYELIFLVLSHTVIATSNSGFGTLTAVFQLYTIILILISMTVVHEFSFFKSMALAIVIVVGMCVAAFILFIMLSLGQDAVSFVVGIVKEISLR